MELVEMVDAFCAGLRGERQWRNVQDVLLTSFRSVGDILALQTRQLVAAERQIAALDQRQQQMRAKLDAVPSIPGDWRTIAAEIIQTQLGQAMDELQQRIDKQVGEQVAAAVDEQAAALANTLKTEVEKAVAASIGELVSSKVEPIDAQLKTLTDRVKALEACLPEVPPPSLEKRLEELQMEIEQGAGGAMVEKVEAELRQLDKRLSTQLASWRQEIDRGFAAKVDKSELEKLLSRKMDTLDGWKQLEGKASTSRVDSVAGRLMDAIHAVQQAATSDLSELRRVCDAKTDAAEFEQLKFGMSDLLAVAESMQSELSSVRTSPQSHETPQPTASHDEELQSLASQLAAVKRQLRSELYQARYIWKSGAPSSRQTVNWDTQVLNTNSEVFTWKAGSDRIQLLVPGLYHIQASFFTTFAPTITVAVNGEPAMRLQAPSLSPTPPSSSPPPPPRASGIVQRMHHSAGNVAGVTLDGVFALPSNAVLSISYDIHERAQGLLNIRKM